MVVDGFGVQGARLVIRIQCQTGAQILARHAQVQRVGAGAGKQRRFENLAGAGRCGVGGAGLIAGFIG